MQRTGDKYASSARRLQCNQIVTVAYTAGRINLAAPSACNHVLKAHQIGALVAADPRQHHHDNSIGPQNAVFKNTPWPHEFIALEIERQNGPVRAFGCNVREFLDALGLPIARPDTDEAEPGTADGDESGRSA